MMPFRESKIAVLGDEDLVRGLRLAGVKTYHIIKEDSESREEAKKILDEMFDDPYVGVIIVQENHMEFLGSTVEKFRKRGKLTPLVLEVPSKQGIKYADITEYYKKYVRDFIGFEIEI